MDKLCKPRENSTSGSISSVWMRFFLLKSKVFSKNFVIKYLTNLQLFHIISMMHYCADLFLCAKIRTSMHTSRKEDPTLWRWHSSPRLVREQRYTVSVREWALPTAERFWLPEELRVESSYPRKAAISWPFVFSVPYSDFS